MSSATRWCPRCRRDARRVSDEAPAAQRHNFIPASLPLQAHGNKALAMQGLMLGFVVMMILDVSLG